MTEIRHENASPTILSEIDYTYAIDNVVTQRSQYDSTTGNTSVVTFGYDDASRLIRIENRHDTVIKTKTFYTYDDADRVTEIRHENASATILSEIDYVYAINNVVTQRSEYDSTTGNTSVVTFGYDDRDRLTSESRTQDNPYSLSYTYDGLGNRLTKTDDSDPLNVVTTEYTYDVTVPDPDPALYTLNNRLRDYGVDYDDDGADDRIVFYIYYKTGHVSNITIKDEGSGDEYDKYRDLALYYARNGTLWLAVWSNFTLDGEGLPEDYTVTAAREFRYDNPRQRYMTRDYDVSGGDDPGDWDPQDLASWTDYNGMMPYLDFDLDNDRSNNATFDEVTRYLAGMGIAARQDETTEDDEFLHGDLIRSTVMTTDDTGAVNDTLSYTAFGQLVTSAGIGGELPAGFPRYAYAGGWGYESDLLVLDGAPGTESIVLQHVGARWYQPDTGRFIMRDPIGIDAGLNVYLYGDNDPLAGVDPDGESWWPNKGIIRYGPSKVRTGYRRWGTRLTFRIGPKIYIYGARGAAVFGGSCLGAAVIGAGVGTGLNWATKKVTGRSISERLGRWIYDRTNGPRNPDYDPEG